MGKEDAAGMQVIFERVCGLDVHKGVVVASVRIMSAGGGGVQQGS